MQKLRRLTHSKWGCHSRTVYQVGPRLPVCNSCQRCPHLYKDCQLPNACTVSGPRWIMIILVNDTLTPLEGKQFYFFFSRCHVWQPKQISENGLLRRLNGSYLLNWTLQFTKGHVSCFNGLTPQLLIKETLYFQIFEWGFGVMFLPRLNETGTALTPAYLLDDCYVILFKGGYTRWLPWHLHRRFSSFTLLADNRSGRAILLLLSSLVVTWLRAGSF